MGKSALSRKEKEEKLKKEQEELEVAENSWKKRQLLARNMMKQMKLGRIFYESGKEFGRNGMVSKKGIPYRKNDQ